MDINGIFQAAQRQRIERITTEVLGKPVPVQGIPNIETYYQALIIEDELSYSNSPIKGLLIKKQ